jgi:predicted RNA-binding protein YlqC (UPF0109 family)
MKELIRSIASALVDYPNQISIEEFHGDYSSVLKLHVAKADMGKVIGKQGRTADGIRRILQVAAAHNQRRAVLKIIDKPKTYLTYKRSEYLDSGNTRPLHVVAKHARSPRRNTSQVIRDRGNGSQMP